MKTWKCKTKVTKNCFIINLAHGSSQQLEAIARNLVQNHFALTVLHQADSQHLERAEIAHKHVDSLASMQKLVCPLACCCCPSQEIILIAQEQEDDAKDVEKMNLIRVLAKQPDQVAIFLQAADMAALEAEDMDMDIKKRYALAAKALKYCAKMDEQMAMQLTNMQHSFGKRILVIGSGGREHALVSKLAMSRKVADIFIAPGNAGTATESEKCCNVNIAEEDIEKLLGFAVREQIDLVVVGPEQPLAAGITEAMQHMGIKCFGPTSAAAQIEASKACSKAFMGRHAIPTASYRAFNNFPEAEQYLQQVEYKVVVKASGLAAGKGVIIPGTKAEAIAAAKAILEGEFGDAGNEIIVEEFLEGEEVSVLAFCDGLTAKGMPVAQDHKRIYDNDQGPNTGGMGAYAPSPLLTPLQQQMCMEIIQVTLAGMAAEGRPFVGVLYAGFLWTAAGPRVLEYNARFGDPEAQVILPLLTSDLYEICCACVEGRLDEEEVIWKTGRAAVTVVCAAAGYPTASCAKGTLIHGLQAAGAVPSAKVYHAAAALRGAQVVTNGGRVLAVTGTGDSLQAAVHIAYAAIHKVSFDGMHYRHDIAQRALQRPLRLGVLGSTAGTSLQAIIDAIAIGHLHAQIAIVISNRASAGILQKAALHGLQGLHVSATGKRREDYDAEVIHALQLHGVDLVLMIGYMRIVTTLFADLFANRCLNVHPSLLPEFAGGMDREVHQAVLQAQRSKSGCTVHLVTADLDAGPIVLQKECAVEQGETVDSLKAKVQALEGPALIEAIQAYMAGTMLPKESISYAAAGVDIDAGEALVQAIKPLCKATRRPGCDAELGGFGGLFDLSQAGYQAADTVLVSGTDGVGTKLMIAQLVNQHDSIGLDLVAMCVNDILVCGAEPLFFLDYYATGALMVEQAAEVIKGIAEGCQQAGCALIGGETAEMAGMYGKGEYDLAGFAVGAVRRADILPKGIQEGDVLIGLPSSGLHSNGFALVRKCVEKAGACWTAPAPFDPSMSLAEALLVPTKIYVKTLLPLIQAHRVKGLAHITGGGLLDNLPRILPSHLAAVVDLTAAGWTLPAVFQWVQSIANLSQQDLLRTFNCGVGMVLVVAAEEAEQLLEVLQPAYRLGEVVSRGEGPDAQAVVVKGEFL